MKRLIVVSLVLAALLTACIVPTAYAQEITPSEQAYATTMIDLNKKVSEAFDELSELMANPRMGDDEWTINVAVQLATIRVLYEEAMEIDPPASMAHIHYKYVQGMKHYETATHLIAKGLDELDTNLIDQATTEIYAGAQFVNEATELTNEFTETRLTQAAPPPAPPAPPPPPAKEGGDCGCFIATAAYGTDTAQEINTLREFRDEVLIPNSLGSELVHFYYKTSPPIADFISRHEVLRTIVREGFLRPIVTILDWTHNLWSKKS